MKAHQERRKLLTDTFEEIPVVQDVGGLVAAWQNRNFLAQLYKEENGYIRFTVSRTIFTNPDKDMIVRWRDGITWDELMIVKAGCGFGDIWALEVYPPDYEVIDRANMRHLWLFDDVPPFAWRKS